jgi:hypothetical protein
MCNLYSETKGQAAIRGLFRAAHDRTGNIPAFPGIFPDQLAPIVRNNADRERELVMARWGTPGPPQFGGQLVTNIRNVASPPLRGWLGAKNRYIVPTTSFYEYAPTTPRKTAAASLAAVNLDVDIDRVDNRVCSLCLRGFCRAHRLLHLGEVDILAKDRHTVCLCVFENPMVRARRQFRSRIRSPASGGHFSTPDHMYGGVIRRRLSRGAVRLRQGTNEAPVRGLLGCVWANPLGPKGAAATGG